MSISLTGSELINIALGIEKEGIAFYDTMARSTLNGATRDLFQSLAEMEREHVKIFQGMLAEADKALIMETYSGELAAYIQSLVDSAVFTDELVTSEMVARAGSDIEAMELAISAEKDSILFYYDMKEMMPQRAQLMVAKIIAEEKSHLRQLSEQKKKLSD